MEVNDFKNKLLERFEARLCDETFNEITVGGSRLRFEMAMAIVGDANYEALLTKEQYHSGIYNSVIEDIFNLGLQESKKHEA